MVVAVPAAGLIRVKRQRNRMRRSRPARRVASPGRTGRPAIITLLPSAASPSASTPAMDLLPLLADPQVWIAFLTLTALELVLGIDNVIFISILVDRLPAGQPREGAPDRPLPGDVHAHRAAAAAVLDGRADRAAVQRRRQGHLGPRPDPDRRRALPALEEHARDPPAARRRRGRVVQRRARDVRRGDPADHHHRHRVLARLDHHRGRHGRQRSGDDRRGGRRRSD